MSAVQVNLDHCSITLLPHFGRVVPNPEWTVGSHAHPHCELHVVHAGHGYNRVGDGVLELLPDTVYLAPPFEEHSQWTEPAEPIGLFFFHFELQLHDSSKALPRIHMPIPYIKRDAASVFHMGEAERRYAPFNPHVPPAPLPFRTQLRFIELLWTILEPTVCDLTGKSPAAEGPTGRFAGKASPQHHIDRAIVYIRETFLANPSLEEIAKYTYMSTRQLSRLFTAQIGCTVHQFVQQERYIWAADQLRRTLMTVQEIGYTLHFSTPQYFSQWFKATAGMTPGEYRDTYGC